MENLRKENSDPMTEENESLETVETRKKSDLDLYLEASPGTQAEKDQARQAIFDLIERIKKLDLPSADFTKAQRVIKFLREEGFNYGERTEYLPEVMAKKEGSCKSLALLLGVVLKELGIDCKYLSYVDVYDLQFLKSKETLDDLLSGLGEVKQNSPLPAEQENYAAFYRFIRADHLTLVVTGQEVEPTDIAGQETPPTEKLKAGQVKEETFEQLISNLYHRQALETLKAQEISQRGRIDYETVEALLQKALDLNPQNQYAWRSLYLLARSFFKDKEAQVAKEQFLAIPPKDAYSYYWRYQMSGQEDDLAQAGDLSPTDYAIFVEKMVGKKMIAEGKTASPNNQDAKFNFTVISYCIANTSPALIDLRDFYLSYAPILPHLYPGQRLKELFDELNIQDYRPYDYLLSLYYFTEDKHYLEQIARKKTLWPKAPFDQLTLALLGAKADIPALKDLFEDLKKCYSDSKIFQEICASQ